MASKKGRIKHEQETNSDREQQNKNTHTQKHSEKKAGEMEMNTIQITKLCFAVNK